MRNVNKTFKLILILGIVFLGFLFLGTTKVDATSIGVITSGTVTENSLDNLSSTVNVNLNESECEKTTEEVLKQIISELEKQNITVRDISNEYNEFLTDEPDNYVRIWVSLIEINKVNISIDNIIYNDDKTSSNNSKEIINKDIKVVYNNSSSYNATDKKYVEDLISNITNNTGTYSYIEYSDLQDSSKIFVPNKKIEEAINDKSIELVYSGGGSGSGPDAFDMGGEGIYYVFKNGVYYADIIICNRYRHQIIIPDNVENTESAYINYAIPVINNYIQNDYEYPINGKVSKLEKISGYFYKVYIDENYNTSENEIVIRKEEGTPIGNNIFVNNLEKGIKITSTVKENITMETELKNKGYTDILGSYELSLDGTTKLTSPIDITFNVGIENNNKTVYILHKRNNGTYENFEKKVTNGKVTITVSELSPFVIAVKEEKETTNTDKEPVIDNTTNNTENNNNKLDETPKTGIEISYNLCVIVIAISIIGIYVINKNRKVKE